MKTLLVQDMTLLVPPVVLKGPQNDEPMAVPKPNFLKVEKVSQEIFCVKKTKNEMPFSIIEFLRLSGVTFDPYRANSSILLNYIRELFISYTFM